MDEKEKEARRNQRKASIAKYLEPGEASTKDPATETPCYKPRNDDEYDAIAKMIKSSLSANDTHRVVIEQQVEFARALQSDMSIIYEGIESLRVSVIAVIAAMSPIYTDSGPPPDLCAAAMRLTTKEEQDEAMKELAKEKEDSPE